MSAAAGDSASSADGASMSAATGSILETTVGVAATKDAELTAISGDGAVS